MRSSTGESWSSKHRKERVKLQNAMSTHDGDEVNDMYQLSVLPVSFFPQLMSGSMSLEQWASMAKKYGLRYVDVPNWVFRNHMPVYLLQQKAVLDALDIEIGAIGTHCDFTHPDPAQRKRELEYLRGDIALASQMGACFVRVTDGQAHPGVTLEQGLDYAEEGLRKAAQSAREHGVQLALENHGFPSAWIYDDFSHDITVFRKLVERLRGSGVGVNFDNANATGSGMDAAQWLRELYPDVVSVHLADTSSPHTTVHTALGAGISPIAQVLRILKDRGFSGLISIEEDAKQGETGIFQAISHVRGIWNSL